MANDTILNFNVNNDIKITPTLRYSNNALFLIKEDFEQDNDVLKLIFNAKDSFPTVSYTHLTLPTNREV